MVQLMLSDFIMANREQIIERSRQRVLRRSAPKLREATLDFGVPLFLTQLIEALAREEPSAPLHLVRARPSAHVDASPSPINHAAALHGHELLRSGFSIGQVVHGYGDVCQVVTDLAHDPSARRSVRFAARARRRAGCAPRPRSAAQRAVPKRRRSP